MTYADILSLFNLKLDKETNAYFSNAEIAQILNGALYRLLEDRYRAFESSTRISEHLSPLIIEVGRDVVPAIDLYPNETNGWSTAYTEFNSELTTEYTGWLYVLAAKIQLTQRNRTFSNTAVLQTSTNVTERNIKTVPMLKVDIGSERINDPYLEGGFPELGSHNLEDLRVYYQLRRGGIKIITREMFSTSGAHLYGILGPDTNSQESARILLTVIQKPTEFTASLLTGSTQYTDLTEPGTRDLVEYAIQIASEVTREKDEYQFISSQIQKDLL